MTAVDEVKARIDIVDLISSEVALKRSGSTYKAPCPFHAERTPSFVVSPERQSWHCFGACSEGGDIFTWEMKRHNVDFREALARLAERAGVQLQSRNPEQDERRKRLLLANDAALHFWRSNLHDPAVGRDTRDYLQERGISIESAGTFNLGLAGSDPGALVHHLSARGIRLEDAEAAGLVIQTERGPVDRFRDRLMFPIRNARSETVGFGGRTLINEPAKYVNTPESDLFRKRNLLYGFDLARPAIRDSGQVIIVEGYTDVISAHESGSANTVASMGTALTDTQVGLIKPLATDIRLALDPDAAGQAAARRGIDTAREALGSVPTVATDFRRVGQIQNALSNDIRVIPLPEGRDPDELIRMEPELWKELVEEAPRFLDWLLEHTGDRHDLETPRGRQDYVNELMPTIRTIGDAVLREEYTRRIAAHARVDRTSLASGFIAPSGSSHREATASSPTTAPVRDKHQSFVLQMTVHYPTARAVVDADDLVLIEDAEDRLILEAAIDRPDALASEISAAFPDHSARIAQLSRDAAAMPRYSDDDAVAAVADAIKRIRTKRIKEGLRLKNLDLSTRERSSSPEDAVRAAALIGNEGTHAVQDPDLLEEAMTIIGLQDSARQLHQSEPTEPVTTHGT